MQSAWVAFVAVLGLLCPCAVGTPEVHDNYLQFQGVSSIEWSETLHSITSGQPYDGVSTFGASIRVKAGRKGSPGPAADLFGGMGFHEHVLGLDAKAKQPGDLNFATFGALSATFPSGATRTCDSIRIGQGHAGAANNWWVASENCVQTKNDGFVCEKCGISFFPGDGDHAFKVREIEVDTGLDNILKFDGANQVEWTEELHSIASGQPYEGVECQENTCDIRAGRQGSPGAAAQFFDGLDLANVIAIGGGTAPSLSRRLLATVRPQTLNFATFGKMTAKFPFGATRTCEGMRIGRGGATGKDWFIGSKDCLSTGGRLHCEKCGVVLAAGDRSCSPSSPIVHGIVERAGSAAMATCVSLAMASAAFAGVEVKMGSDTGALVFEPSTVEIAKGASVTWVNNAGFPHNIVFDEDNVPSGVDAEKLSHEDYFNSPGEKYEATFDTPGTYGYYCEPHKGAGMAGKIVVK